MNVHALMFSTPEWSPRGLNLPLDLAKVYLCIKNNFDHYYCKNAPSQSTYIYEEYDTKFCHRFIDMWLGVFINILVPGPSHIESAAIKCYGLLPW